MRHGLLALELARQIRERPDQEPWRYWSRHPALEPRKRPLTRRVARCIPRALKPRAAS
jgi:hypothetical protein